MLVALSEKMPDDPREISACFKTGVPTFIRMNILELARLIKDAKNNVAELVENNVMTEKMNLDVTESTCMNIKIFLFGGFFCFHLLYLSVCYYSFR